MAACDHTGAPEVRAARLVQTLRVQRVRSALRVGHDRRMGRLGGHGPHQSAAQQGAFRRHIHAHVRVRLRRQDRQPVRSPLAQHLPQAAVLRAKLRERLQACQRRESAAQHA